MIAARQGPLLFEQRLFGAPGLDIAAVLNLPEVGKVIAAESSSMDPVHPLLSVECRRCVRHVSERAQPESPRKALTARQRSALLLIDSAIYSGQVTRIMVRFAATQPRGALLRFFRRLLGQLGKAVFHGDAYGCSQPVHVPVELLVLRLGMGYVTTAAPP